MVMQDRSVGQKVHELQIRVSMTHNLQHRRVELSRYQTGERDGEKTYHAADLSIAKYLEARVNCRPSGRDVVSNGNRVKCLGLVWFVAF